MYGLKPVPFDFYRPMFVRAKVRILRAAISVLCSYFCSLLLFLFLAAHFLAGFFVVVDDIDCAAESCGRMRIAGTTKIVGKTQVGELDGAFISVLRGPALAITCCQMGK